MINSIIKKTVTEAESSLYQSYPQFGDSVYVIDESDDRFAKIKEWCKKETTALYRSFNVGEGQSGFWFAADAEKFERAWM